MDSNKEIYLIGVGNYTEVIIELAQECGFFIKGLYHYNDTRNGEVILGIPILSSFDSILSTDEIKGKNFAVAVGDNNKRSKIAKIIREQKGNTPSLIHPLSKKSTSTEIGVGCFIHAYSNLWTKSKIGNDCIISPSALISHHSTIMDNCFITSFSIIGSYSTIGFNTFVGLNSVILPKINIGNNCYIGAKSNVTKSLTDNLTVIGNPAKRINEK